MDNDSAKALRQIRENEKFTIEAVIVIAKMNWQYFQELKGRGFAEDQALELVKAHGMNMYGGK
jgi:hypothetical protein